jgi:cysteine-rich repeat protein
MSMPPARCGRLRPSRLVGALVVVALGWALPSATAAHGGLPRLPLGLWGPFGAPTVRCMRSLSHAAQHCFRDVLAAHRTCAEARLLGRSCDEGARTAQIEAAMQAAEAAVDTCRGGQLTELKFVDAADAKQDMRIACAEAHLAYEMVYAPRGFVFEPGNSSATERRCVSQTAEMSIKLLGFTLRTMTRVFDPIGIQVLGPSQKIALLTRANQRLSVAKQKLAAHLAGECPSFAQRYGRDPGAFLAALERRSDCLVGLMYYQTSVDCPLPVCGDGIREAGEECDDANGVDADGCRSDCTAT